MPPSSPAAALLGELYALHRDIVFPGAFDRLQWGMVASYECDVSRKGSDIHVHKTTFWVSPDKDPCGAMTIDFGDSSGAMGANLTHEALTQATQTEADLSIVIGFAPNEHQAKKALREHKVKSGGHSALVDQLQDGDAVPSARAARSARRRSSRRSR
jgi:hypothetical protein